MKRVEKMMTRRTEVDVREIVRVIFSGMAGFVAVDFFLMPWLMEQGLGFPNYLYLAIAATGGLAGGISLILRPRNEPDKKIEIVHPAE
jgi:hypothetical protein